MSEHFEPCPFCGAGVRVAVEERGLVLNIERDGSTAQVVCLKCSAAGPLVPVASVPPGNDAARVARLKWNFRAAAAAAAVDRIGEGADRAKRDAQRGDLLVLVHALLEDVMRPAALPQKRTAGVWWDREAVTAEQAARVWLESEGLA